MNKDKTVKKNYQFKWILRKGKRAETSVFHIFILPNKDDKKRLGIAISKSVKGSVNRNMIKRKIREVYRLNLRNIQSGYNMIIINKKNNFNVKDALLDFEECLKKLKIYKCLGE